MENKGDTDHLIIGSFLVIGCLVGLLLGTTGTLAIQSATRADGFDISEASLSKIQSGYETHYNSTIDHSIAAGIVDLQAKIDKLPADMSKFYQDDADCKKQEAYERDALFSGKIGRLPYEYCMKYKGY